MEDQVVFHPVDPDEVEAKKQLLVETLTSQVRRRVEADAAQSRHDLLAYAKEQVNLDENEQAILADALMDLEEEADSMESAFRYSLEQKLGIEKKQIAVPDVIVVDVQRDTQLETSANKKEGDDGKEGEPIGRILANMLISLSSRCLLYLIASDKPLDKGE